MAENPYLERVAIRQIERFYGRRRETARILSRIGAARPQSVSIVGERRMGKSSLLNYICNKEIRKQYIENYDSYVFVPLDFQQRRGLQLSDFFAELISRLLSTVDISSVLTPDFDGVRLAVNSLQNKGLKIVVLMDEFDAITSNPAFGEDFFSFFRSLANSNDLAYITSSRRDLQELCHTSRIADSPFFNIFSTLNIGGFTPDEARQLIREPSAASGFPLEPFTDGILSLSGLFPGFLQMACSAYFESRSGNHVDESMAVDVFRDEATPHFNYLWEIFTPDMQTVFQTLQRGETVPPHLVYLAQRLIREGYLVGSMPKPRFFSRVFEEFVSEKSAGTISQQETTIQVAAPVITNAGPFSPPPLETHPDGTPSRIDTFRVNKLLGEGGMGVVYQATDIQLGRTVAIKILPPSMATNSTMRLRFLKEARAASVLNHPNICTIYQVGQAGDVDYIVMEYLEGVTLKDLLARGPIPMNDALRMTAQAAEALSHAHTHGMIHRDIKPANLMRLTDGRVKVLDFGLVKQFSREAGDSVTSALTGQGAIIGTVNYMSPEQIRGDNLDPRSDLFSLGVVLYELLTNRSPFQAANYIGIMHAILTLPALPLPAQFPPAVIEIVNRLLQKNPEERYSDGDALRSDILTIVA